MLLCHSSFFAAIYKEVSMTRLIFTITLTCFLSACSNYKFSSNLDKKNIEEYFIPSSVKIYEKDQLPEMEYKVLGAVQGSSCQIKENDLPADIKDARTKARINAAALKANGVVFQTCINFEPDNSCISNIICYGRALKVEHSNE